MSYIDIDYSKGRNLPNPNLAEIEHAFTHLLSCGYLKDDLSTNAKKLMDKVTHDFYWASCEKSGICSYEMPDHNLELLLWIKEFKREKPVPLSELCAQHFDNIEAQNKYNENLFLLASTQLHRCYTYKFEKKDGIILLQRAMDKAATQIDETPAPQRAVANTASQYQAKTLKKNHLNKGMQQG